MSECGYCRGYCEEEWPHDGGYLPPFEHKREVYQSFTLMRVWHIWGTTVKNMPMQTYLYHPYYRNGKYKNAWETKTAPDASAVGLDHPQGVR